MPYPVKQEKQGNNSCKKTITQKSDVGHYSIQKWRMKAIEYQKTFCFWYSIDINYSYDQEGIVIIKILIYKLCSFSQFRVICLFSANMNT